MQYRWENGIALKVFLQSGYALLDEKLGHPGFLDYYAQGLVFLALLCATAQQSYCRHAGVRRPSVVRP